jgi:glycosyltransferase involved in cell wall biosynthesis
MGLFFLLIFLLTNLVADFSAYNIAINYEKADYERPLVVCIPSFNNERYYEKCLKSVFSQKYSNYRVIYIDDHSTDNTYKGVLAYVKEQNQDERTIVIRNEENKGMLYNHYTMAELCDGYEIIVSLDGDDTFYDENALSRINKAYMDPDVWATYGQFVETGIKYHQKPRAMLKHKLEPNVIRQMPFLFMQPRTYYAELFHNIPKSYLMMGNDFFRTAGDVAIMMFIIDLARSHTYFIPEILYAYNNENPLNDHKIDRRYQLQIEKHIKMIPPLKPLNELSLECFENFYW